MDPTLIVPVVMSSATVACATCCLGYHFGPECMRCTCSNLANAVGEMSGAHAERRHRLQIELAQQERERERARAHAQQVEALMRQAAMGAERVAQEEAARRELFRDPRNYTHIEARVGHPPVITTRRAQLAIPRASGMSLGGVIPDDDEIHTDDESSSSSSSDSESSSHHSGQRSPQRRRLL